jgi:fumarate hydratase class I
MTGAIRDADLVNSVRDALQFISYYHPADFVSNLAWAFEREQNPAAKNAIGQILVNSRMAALGHRPICQDTGTVSVFLRVGIRVQFDFADSLEDVINEGVRQAYTYETNPLRASLLADPIFARTNTGDNTPAIIHTEIVPGDSLSVTVVAKGGGSENKARFAALEPRDSVSDWVVETVAGLGAGWCPPGIIGLGVGGSPEKAMLMAKQSLLEPLDMPQILARGPASDSERLRVELYERINDLGIGAQGLGGTTTVLDVKLRTFPAHAACKPVGLIPQCAANRHIEFVLDGSGPAAFEPPPAAVWPNIVLENTAGAARRVNLDQLTTREVAIWKAGDLLLLSGKMLTGRDAAHARIAKMVREDEALPVDLRARTIYYTGPVDAVSSEVIGPAGPTTATRMDPFTETMLQKGLLVMIGKAERGPETIESIRRHGAAYLVAVGGAAYLISRSITSARVVAFADLGMEAMYEMSVDDMPVTVAVDARGTSIHTTGPASWRRATRPDAELAG